MAGGLPPLPGHVVRPYSSGMPARPLRDVFTDLLGQPGTPDGPDAASEVLHASGHLDLPDGLVAEAVVNFADTAPIEVAEQLHGFVAAHSPVPGPDLPDEPPSWLEALTSTEVPAELDGWPEPADLGPAHLTAPEGDDATDPAALDFGRGDTDTADAVHAGDAIPGPAEHRDETAGFDADFDAWTPTGAHQLDDDLITDATGHDADDDGADDDSEAGLDG